MNMKKIDFSKSADEVIAEARQRINNLLRLFNEQKQFERIQEAGGQRTPGRSPPRSGGSSPLSTSSGLPGSPLSYTDNLQCSRGRSPSSCPFSAYSRPPGSPMSYRNSPSESPTTAYPQIPGSPLPYTTSPEASPEFQPFPRSPLTAAPPPSPHSSPTASPYSSAYSSPRGYSAADSSPASAHSAPGPGGYPDWDVLTSPDRMDRMVEETKQAIAEFRARLDEICMIAKAQPGHTQGAFMEPIYESLPFDNTWPHYQADLPCENK